MTPEQYVQDKAAAQRLELLLRLPVPAAAAARGDHRLLRLLPRGRRRRRRGPRPRRGRHQARLVAQRGRRELRRPAEPSGDAGADAAHRRLRHRAAALLAVIDGCQMDLEQTRYLDFAGLARYCHLVAGVVGEVAANIFGRHAARRPSHYAHRLGLAMQLTNIIRDVGDDARRGRIYLPVDELQRSTSRRTRLLEAPGYSERFTALMRFQAERAHRCYDEALALLARRRPARAEARADDGQHLPHAAARDRGRRLPGAAPAHLADAAAQAVDRDAHATGAGAEPAHARASPRRDRRRLGRAGRGGRGRAARRRGHAVRDGAAARRPRPRRRAPARRRRSTTASTS